MGNTFKLLFATSNPHKFEEMTRLLKPTDIELLGLSDLDFDTDEPKEDGPTLESNARIKALAYARASGIPCLADDSGLEVGALGGAPGVRSARYSGEGQTRAERDRKNREKLLQELAKLRNVDRSAHLVCTLCLASSQGEVLFETRGSCQAQIVDAPRGASGFGYDVLLYLPELKKTAGEVTPEEWNPISHRGQAAQRLLSWLQANQKSPLR